MDWDEPTKKPTTVTVGEDLSTMGVAELSERIEALNGEIERVESEIAKKKAQANALGNLPMPRSFASRRDCLFAASGFVIELGNRVCAAPIPTSACAVPCALCVV